jgi:hypothetical protein
LILDHVGSWELALALGAGPFKLFNTQHPSWAFPAKTNTKYSQKNAIFVVVVEYKTITQHNDTPHVLTGVEVRRNGNLENFHSFVLLNLT